MDFNKNLPIPNIATNDVYCRRQLSLFSSMCIDLLISTLFSTLIRKWQQRKEVTKSALFRMIVSRITCHLRYNIYISSPIRVPGKIKMEGDEIFTLDRHRKKKRFNSATVTFLIRGHSYIECDKDMVLVDQKIRAEVTNDWI